MCRLNQCSVRRHFCHGFNPSTIAAQHSSLRWNSIRPYYPTSTPPRVSRAGSQTGPPSWPHVATAAGLPGASMAIFTVMAAQQPPLTPGLSSILLVNPPQLSQPSTSETKPKQLSGEDLCRVPKWSSTKMAAVTCGSNIRRRQLQMSRYSYETQRKLQLI